MGWCVYCGTFSDGDFCSDLCEEAYRDGCEEFWQELSFDMDREEEACGD